MSYLRGERRQGDLFPASIEDYVSANDPVRVYDAFVEGLDLGGLGLDLDGDQVGAPEYDPKAMVKLLLYGYSYGIRSSRKLERATHHNLSFIWLMGGLKPDHKTIARFRRSHLEVLKGVLKQCARLCLKLGLIEGNTLFVDGTKVKANASEVQSWSRKECERYLGRLDARIEAILADSESADGVESKEGSWVGGKKGKLASVKEVQERVRRVMAELEDSGRNCLNTTDKESVVMMSGRGFVTGYNMQAVVDDRNGLIVTADVVAENNDLRQFGRQIEAANGVVDGRCMIACGDCGYSNTELLKGVAEQGIRVIVPSQWQSLHHPPGPFHHDKFVYDARRDGYICPEGHFLAYRKTDYGAGQKAYQMKPASVCRRCQHFGQCTKSKEGRTLVKLLDEEWKRYFEREYLKPEGQAIYKRRKERVEHLFGHIKRNLGVNTFLLRGLKGVQGEASLLATCFNLTRMITLMGVIGLTGAMARVT